MQSMYAITTTTRFSAAHAIRLYDGSLEPLHGHNWCVEVTVAADELDAIETVMDFHELERLVERVVTPSRNGNLNAIPTFIGAGGMLAVNPTAERVAWWIGEAVIRELPDRVKLMSVRVEEAPGCFATYRPR